MKPEDPNPKPTILVVDDNPTNIRVLAEILLRDYEVLFAKRGREALEIARGTELTPVPDLVLLDIVMPYMDGYEVCRRLRKNRITRDIPVIFVTIRTDKSHEVKGLSMGAVDYIPKPFDAEVVKSRIRTHLELKRHREELRRMVEERTAELAEANEELKRQVRRAEELQKDLIRAETLAATGKLAAVVAHEINSPMQGMLSLTDLVETLCTGEEPKKYLSMLRESIRTTILKVKRMRLINLPPKDKKWPTNINTILENTMGLMEGVARKRAVDLTVNLDESIPDSFLGIHELSQVFINLINNAVEAIAGEEDPIIEFIEDIRGIVGEIRVDSALVDGEIQITVADTGPGIDPADLPHIFDHFFTRKKKMGMGVGLAICQDIIWDHHGVMTAENPPEGGALFTIRMPPITQDPSIGTYRIF